MIENCRRGALLLLGWVAILTSCSSPKEEPPADLFLPSPVADKDSFAIWRRYGHPQTVKLFEEYAKANRGEPADLDGDGEPETTASSLPNGGTRWVSDPGQTGVFDWTLEESPGGDRVTLVDADRDGRWDLREEETADGSLHVVLSDTDGDGRLEERRTERKEAQFTRVTVERDPDGSGSFTQVDEYTVPLVLAAGATQCQANDYFVGDFPGLNDDGTETLDYNNATVRIIDGTNDSRPGACQYQEIDDVAAAVECALGMLNEKRGVACLEQTNAALGRLFRTNLLRKEIAMSCGLTCDTVAGATLAAGTRRPYISLNRGYFFRPDPDELCETVFHELLHATQTVAPGTHHNEGDPNDQVYACAMYCSGCRTDSLIQPAPTTNETCTRCAGTPEEKRRCGVEQKVTDMTCPQLALCHGSIGNNQACETCKGTEEVDCLGQPLGNEASFLCCNTCPLAANLSNDEPCVAVQGGEQQGTCHQKPAMCQ